MSSDETVAAPAEVGEVRFTATDNVTHVWLDYDERVAATSNSRYSTKVRYDADAARVCAQEHRAFAALMDAAANELDDTADQEGRARRYHIGEVAFASNGNMSTVEYDDAGRVVVTDSQGARRTWTPTEARRLAEDHAALVHMLMLASREAETPF